jgi:tetratricopeptide (TPR) repeat protein
MSTPPDIDAVNAQASVWMKRGLALLDARSPASLTEAIACFDRAIDLRRRLPLDAMPALRYGLAAGWLNRGDALTRLGGDDDLAAALAAFDEALRLLDGLPLDDDPRVRRRVAIAWHNRGLALQAEGGARLADARQAFERARDLLEDPRAAVIPDRALLLATAWTNLANAWLGDESVDAMYRAKDGAERAMAIVDPAAVHADLAVAEIAIKARHVLCQAIALVLSETDVDEAATRRHVHAATDAVDDGLAIARQWEQRGVDRFRGLAYDLVRFGARVYSLYQPQFLNEFVIENLDPAHSSGAYVGSPEMRAAALESLWLSFRR